MDLLRRDQDLRDVIAGRDIEAAQATADAADARYEQAAAQVSQAQAVIAQAKAKLDEATAGVAQAQAELDQARVNLDHTIITSPIDGVVVSRNIDVGQTVAASLQAPILFVIANDLSNMQVLASIDEADVGQIQEGVTANFTVDAYRGETFSGRISQIRLNAQEQQNVVTYSAVIDVSNPDQKLLPGMTASIAVLAAHADYVLTVPNAALRFKPDHPDQIIAPTGNPQTDTQGQPSGQASAEAPGASADDRQRLQDRTVWVLNANKKLEPRLVTAGITNGRVTAITGGNLNQGDAVVIGQI
jgi:HlyD family secretion protein